MTQYDATHDAMWDEPQAPRTSLLAVSSLICSLICCLPGVPLIGVLLGILSLVAMAGKSHLTGRGLAIIGIVLGLILSILQLLLVVGLIGGLRQFEQMAAAPLQEAFAGQPDRFRNQFLTTPSESETEAFLEELRDRYGDLQSAELDWGAYFEDLESLALRVEEDGEIPVYLMLTFDRAEIEVEFIMMEDDQRPGGDPVFRWMRIIDPARGDIVFPPGADEESETPAEAEVDPDETS